MEQELSSAAEDYVAITQPHIRAKIIHTLSIWPKLSPSMLQVGIGTALSPKLWHPILNQLIEEGTIIREELSAKSAAGRDQVYTILQLAQKN
jgi:hypothetical protein